MPKVAALRKKPPAGWDLVEEELADFDRQMKEAVLDSHEGYRRCEAQWAIHRVAHLRSRFLFEQYYQRGRISRDLYAYCVREGFVDERLAARWKKPGSEFLCCNRCVERRDTAHGTNCICRVPRRHLAAAQRQPCLQCGCDGCATEDMAANSNDVDPPSGEELEDEKAEGREK